MSYKPILILCPHNTVAAHPLRPATVRPNNPDRGRKGWVEHQPSILQPPQTYFKKMLDIAGEYHAIDVRVQDKTALHFIIDPGFTLENRACRLENRQLTPDQALAAYPQRITQSLESVSGFLWEGVCPGRPSSMNLLSRAREIFQGKLLNQS